MKESGERNILAIFFITLNFLSGFYVIPHANAQAPSCCDTVTGPCATACRQISLMTLAAVSIEVDSNSVQIQSLSSQCPSEMSSFWRCINETLNALREGASWEGRSCCSLAQTPLCQISCVTAAETADIGRGCRRSDEPALYNCLQRQNELEECCGQSNRPDCVATCQALLRQPSLTSTPNVNTRRRLSSVCERESSVISCVANITQVYSSRLSNPLKFLPCCNEGRNAVCREACKSSFASGNSNEKTVMDTLVANGCGHPRPDDKMWGCFLQRVEPKGAPPTPPSKIHRLGMDAPKLHCCHRARDETCRRLCYNTFSREWSGSWSEFDSLCLSSPSQSSLRACVDEVDEPCELGCEGLTFCSAFNGRPSQLFRRCSPGADSRAQAQFQKWIRTGFIPLSKTHQLPLRNDSNCAERWKGVACALELKPCDTKSHVTQICLADCVSLLYQCLDFDQFLDEGQEVSSICDFLSPPSGKPCISLSIYSQASPRLLPSNHARVTRPCQQRPCNRSQICQVNRNGCPNGEECTPYTCVDGCRLGEVSKVVVAPGSLVRVPIRNPGCYHLCHCSSEGVIGNCVQGKCETPSPCWWNQRTRIDHGSTFSIDCNLCSCRSGIISCTKQNCVPNQIGNVGNSSSVGCACPPTPSPVCGSNGKTYFSHCTARCSGLSDAEIRPGNCRELDPCEGVFCGNAHRCIPYRRVCLHSFARKCHQYQCVPFTCQNRDVVCDTGGNQHESLCSMANVGAIFSYRGQCVRQGCSQDGVICGLDGATYNSECAAEGRWIPKDYDGPCRALGVPGASCPKVKCPPLPPHCAGVVPPGACCPLCAGIVRYTFSQAQTLQLAQHTDSQLVTVEEMGKKLESLVQTAECRLGIYLGQAAELVVIIRPRWTPWTKAQLYACVSEAHRLSALVSQKSPILEVDAVLHLLSGASSYELRNGGHKLMAEFTVEWSVVGLLTLSYWMAFRY